MDCKTADAVYQQALNCGGFPISMDGGQLLHYPNAARDNGMAARAMEQLHIPQQHFQVPFTVLANPRTRSMVPVGFGPMTADEMVNRIAMAIRVQLQAEQRDVQPSTARFDVRSALIGAEPPTLAQQGATR